MPAPTILLIPGPVTTDPRVRAPAARDYAPWDNDFREIFARVRRRVVAVAGGTEGVHACMPLPGSGHFAIEAACRSFVPPGGRILLPLTGQYADRMQRLATEAGRVIVPMPVPDNTRVDPAEVQRLLEADPTISHVACVYSETATGIIHDVPEIARAAGRAGRRVIVDAVSALGALPFPLAGLPAVDAVIFTSNKCIEGLPGISFTVSPIERLLACTGNAHSWSFDLPALYAHALQAGWGSHRFTPPAGVIAAFDAALDLFDAEGGQPARLARYMANARVLYEGVQKLGLSPMLPQELQGPIVMNIAAPPDPQWDLQRFVDGLKARGIVISNFYNTKEPGMRIGCIGAIGPNDMLRAVTAMGDVLSEMRIQHRHAA